MNGLTRFELVHHERQMTLRPYAQDRNRACLLRQWTLA